MEIIISSNTSKPIYEQITSQMKAMIMSGELQTGDPIPSMRALAKSLHISVITVQKAYEDLHRDGFIETTVGRGSFVSAQNKDFFQEEQQRRAVVPDRAARPGRRSPRRRRRACPAPPGSPATTATSKTTDATTNTAKDSHCRPTVFTRCMWCWVRSLTPQLTTGI